MRALISPPAAVLALAIAFAAASPAAAAHHGKRHHPASAAPAADRVDPSAQQDSSAQPDQADPAGQTDETVQTNRTDQAAPRAKHPAHYPLAADQSGSDASARADQADQPSEPPPASEAVTKLADWVRRTDDNGELPFVIVDKVAAQVFVFTADGQQAGAAPALVGEALGDDSTPGIGDRDLNQIAPEERTTPAGRFLAAFGPAAGHKTVFWVDYADSISLHPVVTNVPAEHRLERIQSPDPQDHRITFGCINVPAEFYKTVFLGAIDSRAMVYVLPDSRPAEEVFPGIAAKPHKRRVAFWNLR